EEAVVVLDLEARPLFVGGDLEAAAGEDGNRAAGAPDHGLPAADGDRRIGLVVDERAERAVPKHHRGDGVVLELDRVGVGGDGAGDAGDRAAGEPGQAVEGVDGVVHQHAAAGEPAVPDPGGQLAASGGHAFEDDADAADGAGVDCGLRLAVLGAEAV